MFLRNVNFQIMLQHFYIKIKNVLKIQGDSDIIELLKVKAVKSYKTNFFYLFEIQSIFHYTLPK